MKLSLQLFPFFVITLCVAIFAVAVDVSITWTMLGVNRSKGDEIRARQTQVLDKLDGIKKILTTPPPIVVQSDQPGQTELRLGIGNVRVLHD